MGKKRETLVLDMYVNLKEEVSISSPSPTYLLQSYAYQLYRLLDRCNLADRDAIKNPLSAVRLHRGKQDFMMELFEESLLRTLVYWSHDCLH